MEGRSLWSLEARDGSRYILPLEWKSTLELGGTRVACAHPKAMPSRYVSTWLVYGTLVIRAGRTRSGHVVGLASVLIVAGWCVFESMSKNGGIRKARLIAVAHMRKRPATSSA